MNDNHNSRMNEFRMRIYFLTHAVDMKGVINLNSQTYQNISIRSGCYCNRNLDVELIQKLTGVLCFGCTEYVLRFPEN